jgi:hypothetical protein
MSVFVLLIVLALLLAVAALIRPTWPLTPVAVLLICIALLIGKTLT